MRLTSFGRKAPSQAVLEVEIRRTERLLANGARRPLDGAGGQGPEHGECSCKRSRGMYGGGGRRQWKRSGAGAGRW